MTDMDVAEALMQAPKTIASQVKARTYKTNWQKERRKVDAAYREREAAQQLRRYYRIQAKKFLTAHPYEDQPGVR